MVFRKLIKFGNSSFVISIPKNWMEKNGLKRGDSISLKENGDDELILSKTDAEPDLESKEITINVEDKDIAKIKRELVGAYINNNDTMKVIGDLEDKRPAVDSLINNLLALEVMEETPNKLVIKDFLNVKDVSITDVVRRMDLMIRLMAENLKECFDKCKHDEIAKIDLNVNKLRFLIFRVVKGGMENHEYLKHLKLAGCYELLDYWILATNMEDLADNFRRTARYLKKTKLAKKEKQDLKEIFEDIERDYINVMNTFYNRDKDLAHEIASYREEHVKLCNEYLDKTNNKIIATILEKLKSMEAYIKNIARIVINQADIKNEQENIAREKTQRISG